MSSRVMALSLVSLLPFVQAAKPRLNFVFGMLPVLLTALVERSATIEHIAALTAELTENKRCTALGVPEGEWQGIFTIPYHVD